MRNILLLLLSGLWMMTSFAATPAYQLNIKISEAKKLLTHSNITVEQDKTASLGEKGQLSVSVTPHAITHQDYVRVNLEIRNAKGDVIAKPQITSKLGRTAGISFANEDKQLLIKVNTKIA